LSRRVVRRFRSRNPLDDPRPEFFRMLGKSFGFVVSDEGSHRSPFGRKNPDKGSDEGRPQKGRFDFFDVLPGRQKPDDLFIDDDLPNSSFGLAENFRCGEKADHDRDKADPVHQMGDAEIVAGKAGDFIHSYAGKKDADGPPD